MMHDLFLNRSAPLYGRARKLLHVEPVDHAAFCSACDLEPGETDYRIQDPTMRFWFRVFWPAPPCIATGMSLPTPAGCERWKSTIHNWTAVGRNGTRGNEPLASLHLRHHAP